MTWARTCDADGEIVAVEISGSDAEARITERVKRAEAGEGSVPVAPGPGTAARRAVLDAVRAEGRAAASPGPGGAQSHDFLYGEGGLPR